MPKGRPSVALDKAREAFALAGYRLITFPREDFGRPERFLAVKPDSVLPERVQVILVNVCWRSDPLWEGERKPPEGVDTLFLWPAESRETGHALAGSPRPFACRRCAYRWVAAHPGACPACGYGQYFNLQRKERETGQT